MRLPCPLFGIALVLAASGARAEPRPLDLEVDGRWIGNAVCYGPHRDGQRPGGAEPTAEELEEDLRLMIPHWSLLRIYGASGFAEPLLRTIAESGLPMRVMLGLWIAPGEAEQNRNEVEAGIRLANAYPGIVTAVSVGNETRVSWSAHRVPTETLLGHVRTVRKGVEVPVTVADDFAWWQDPQSRSVADEIDFLTVHAHPMWNGKQLDEALPWVRSRLDSVRAIHPGVPVVLGETGWATRVHDQGEQARLIRGRPGEAEQSIYFQAVTDWAEETGQPVFFFEAFDENWKGGNHPDEVEKHWGLFNADRTPKLALETDGEGVDPNPQR